MIFAAAAMLAMPAAAQMMTPQMDTNTDGLLSQDEYNVGFTEAGTFGRYDTDGDAMLSQQEYDAGFADIGEYRDEGFEMGAFGDADADGDGMLNEDEYNTALFNSYDTDRSGDLNEEESMILDRDMGEDGFFNREIDA
ncbi:hypothetical protein [Jannaschia sp. LMIT008]|uniref:hypothetical protein n=1 Tax=Jannaschia maritima TaxID=3032585 RepID=UPI002810E59E|nr:hypothetical protein [Jannaschia sp. LMIT008]